MKKVFKLKSEGLRDSITDFSNWISDFNLHRDNITEFTGTMKNQMKKLEFDKISSDKFGNIVGIIKGYKSQKNISLISHCDIPNQNEKLPGFKTDMVRFKAGIISSLYTGALIKRSLLPLEGDLIVCCVPRFESCEFGIKYLFDSFLRSEIKKIKGIILCEPTDFNVYLGHKGQMEYEIIVKGDINRNFVENKGFNILGTMFPLINELEKLSKTLPTSQTLGKANLKIKDVNYNGYKTAENPSEFKIIAERVFIPEENLQEILNRAKTIAKSVYGQNSNLSINTAVSREKIKISPKVDISLKKEVLPWSMESHNPFVLKTLEVLNENNIKAKTGYWKDILTAGSYTKGILKIPTIGFGAGNENVINSGFESLKIDELIKAICAASLIVNRNIGMPAFGWNDNDI
ncbi:MAG: hypothetical protein PHP69_02795 [Candidatus Omnitrophica bacterium]|nr:hypothetical protein [Candidatus Omnitrophota bacterium]MDD5081094.1 hypothetical protein [Candidatus Omnitrophota bacterium]